METTEILVSVIIPAYNCEAYIEKTIESALIQEVPLEVLILNDCSTDNTAERVKKYLAHPAIRYFQNESNLGAAGSRNKGVRLARGKYVAFLDADDWWEAGKLKKQLTLLEEERAVLCCTAREIVDENGVRTGRVIPVRQRITYRMLLQHNSINCSSVVLLREAALEFPMEHEDSHEDYITWLKILKKYRYACAVNEPLLKYRLSKSGKSGSKLKSARMTFKVYRYMGFGWCKSLICLCSYVLNGIWKYRWVDIKWENLEEFWGFLSQKVVFCDFFYIDKWKGANAMNQNTLTDTVLEGLGVHRGYQGYAYVRHAISLAEKDGSCLKCITKRLYPQIAEDFGTTPACVERNLRTVAKVAVRGSDSELFRTVFRGRGASMLCNKEFLSCLYEYVGTQAKRP